jgi:hypothetical protein
LRCAELVLVKLSLAKSKVLTLSESYIRMRILQYEERDNDSAQWSVSEHDTEKELSIRTKVNEGKERYPFNGVQWKDDELVSSTAKSKLCQSAAQSNNERL